MAMLRREVLVPGTFLKTTEAYNWYEMHKMADVEGEIMMIAFCVHVCLNKSAEIPASFSSCNPHDGENEIGLEADCE